MNIPGHDPGAETGPRQATPFTRFWYWAMLAIGTIIVIGTMIPHEPKTQIADLPGGNLYNLYGFDVDWGLIFQLVIGVFILVGAVLSLLGAQYRDQIDESWNYEWTGAIIGATGWFGFVLAVGIDKPSSLVDAMFPLACGLSLAVRFITLSHREKIVRVAYEVKQKQQLEEEG